MTEQGTFAAISESRDYCVVLSTTTESAWKIFLSNVYGVTTRSMTTTIKYIFMVDILTNSMVLCKNCPSTPCLYFATYSNRFCHKIISGVSQRQLEIFQVKTKHSLSRNSLCLPLHFLFDFSNLLTLAAFEPQDADLLILAVYFEF